MLKSRAASVTAPLSILPSTFSRHIATQFLIPTAIRSQPLSLGNCRFVSKGRDFRGNARRRVRFEDEDEDDKLNDYNPDIAMLELYTQSAKQEALIVRVTVDDDNLEEEILIFKGFSSSLTYGTSPDPSKCILPVKAVVKSIDRVKGPFNPTDIQYIEKGLTLDDLKARLRSI